jgi:hypothetical protein
MSTRWGGSRWNYRGWFGPLGALLAQGVSVGVVVRTFGDDTAFTLSNGVDVPIKTVRSWCVAGGRVRPWRESETFSAFWTDAGNGEPIPPERGVRFVDAWPVEID